MCSLASKLVLNDLIPNPTEYQKMKTKSFSFHSCCNILNLTPEAERLS